MAPTQSSSARIGKPPGIGNTALIARNDTELSVRSCQARVGRRDTTDDAPSRSPRRGHRHRAVHRSGTATLRRRRRRDRVAILITRLPHARRRHLLRRSRSSGVLAHANLIGEATIFLPRRKNTRGIVIRTLGAGDGRAAVGPSRMSLWDPISVKRTLAGAGAAGVQQIVQVTPSVMGGTTATLSRRGLYRPRGRGVRPHQPQRTGCRTPAAGT